MRIATKSDLHFNLPERKEINSQLVEQINKSTADVLVIAGDFATGDFDKNYKPWLDRITYKGPKIAVPGNHDVWGQGELTMKRFLDFNTYMMKKGWHVLDDEPFVVDRVAFVGNMGWYDYSFFTNGDDKHDLEARKLSNAIGKQISRWSDLREYLPAKYIPNVYSWEDANKTNWGKDDPTVAHFFAQKLESDMKRIDKQCDKMVAVTHHLPFEELVMRAYNTKTEFSNAFRGSYSLGRVMRQNQKVDVAICGHLHYPQYKKIGKINAHEVSLYEPEAYLKEIEVKGNALSTMHER